VHGISLPNDQAMQQRRILVPTLAGDKISAITRFGDDSLLPLFGLP